MRGRPGRSRPSPPPILSSAGGPAGKRRRPTKTRTSAQVSAAMRLRNQGVRWGDDRPCTSAIIIPMVDGAAGPLAIGPPPRPPRVETWPRTEASKGREKTPLNAPGWMRSAGDGVTIRERRTATMELSDFAIGETFWTHAGAFRCTDIGTRVVVAVKLGPREIRGPRSVDGELRITKRIDDDPSWLNGPPYAVEEAGVRRERAGGLLPLPRPNCCVTARTNDSVATGDFSRAK